MTRVKGGTVARARRKKVLKEAKGYFGSKHRLYKTAHEQVMHSGQYAFRDRRQNKRNFRKLWITRINAACRENEISYSKFINGLNKAGIEVNRKMLSAIAIDDAKAFAELVNVAKAACEGKVVAPKKAAKAVEVKTEEQAEENDLSKLTLAELKEIEVNWCEGLGTVLANEEILNVGNWPDWGADAWLCTARINLTFAKRIFDYLGFVCARAVKICACRIVKIFFKTKIAENFSCKNLGL